MAPTPEGRKRVLQALIRRVGGARDGWFPDNQQFRADHYADIDSIDGLKILGHLHQFESFLAWSPTGLQLMLPEDQFALQELTFLAEFVDLLQLSYRRELKRQYTVDELLAATKARGIFVEQSMIERALAALSPLGIFTVLGCANDTHRPNVTRLAERVLGLDRAALTKPLPPPPLVVADSAAELAARSAALEPPLQDRLVKTKDTGIRIFISHASVDVKLATKLIAFLRAALIIPDKTIRCTSVPGYKLEGGDDAPDALRNDLHSCNVVLALLTKESVASSYVLMELGAAWALGRRAIPLLGPGATFKELPGPFKDIHALKILDDDMSGLPATIAKETKFSTRDNLPEILQALTDLRELATALGASEVAPPRTFR